MTNDLKIYSIERQRNALDALLDAQEIYEDLGMHVPAMQIASLVAVYGENLADEIDRVFPIVETIN